MDPTSPLDRLVRYSLSGNLPVFILVTSIVLGGIALQITAREEEPQIVVPMVEVLVSSPGLSAKQVERQVSTPLEKLLAQITGVENVYSTSASGKSAVTLRFFVGQDREEAILNTYNKVYANQDKMPGVVKDWLVRPVEVDDVPILMLGLWSEQPERYSDFELRRLGEEISTAIQAIPNTSEVLVTGGRPRTIRILPDPESLSARQSTSGDIVRALQASNILRDAGYWSLRNESVLLESGDFIRSVSELKQTVINVVNGTPVFLQDVAEILDGPAEPDNYSWIDFSRRHPAFQEGREHLPLVTISVAKKRGSNAVSVARETHALLDDLQRELIPDQIHIETLRDYGATANEKVRSLTSSLAFAVFTVVVFIAVFLGWRPALVVGIAVPISYGVTLALDMAFGYTINRVTLFALILSLGLLVDDPITGVDNIDRFLRKGSGSVVDRISAAISEIKTPLVMSTLTIVLAFVPLAFITGMMGPYMAPMAFNVPVSVVISTLVAFTVTPWLSRQFLHAKTTDEVSGSTLQLQRVYERLLLPLLTSRKKSLLALGGVLVLFILASLLPVLRMVPLKLLPYDNKNEIQIVIDMPEAATLEQTAALAKQVSSVARRLNEVQAVANYVGTASPIDFNGLVRHYYQRNAPNLGDLRVTLVDKADREHQSHAVVLRLRRLLLPLNINGISVKVVEVPPGPPVLSTLVAELYGSTLTQYEQLQKAALILKNRLEREPLVVEVDTSVEMDHNRLRFITDKTKAALSGITTSDISDTLVMANKGYVAGFMQIERESRPLPIELRLPIDERSSIHDLRRLQVKGRSGITQIGDVNGLEMANQPLVALGELGEFTYQPADKSIHHKDLKPVVYVTAEVLGRTPIEVIADVVADFRGTGEQATPWDERTFLQPGGGDSWNLPDEIDIVWTGEGEWKITVDVFRDMGIAFVFALVGIFVILNIQTASYQLALIIMSAIPLTIIGIMPGFWLLNQFGDATIAGAPDPVLFTATAMIGMIALAGIVVRNSLILVEFITQARSRGLPIKEALVQAGAIRMRPILLTAGTTLLGNLIITLDPVFSGLALAIIFGILASTIFTLLVIPVVYMLVIDERDMNPIEASR